MKKLSLALILITISIASYCQTYNNEWIDYSKTYYKFKVGATGLYRIPQSALAAAGLGSVAAENFQLWRNGVEQPIYTSALTGALGNGDYIEFYGLINDGKTDTKLYKYDSLQMNNQWSLYTDTSAYFLTVNTSSLNKRTINVLNSISGNTLPAEPFCIYKFKKYYKDNLSPGFGYDLGEIVHASAYETAEGWCSREFSGGSIILESNTKLKIYTAGPPASADAVIAGTTFDGHSVSWGANTTSFGTYSLDDFNILRVHTDNIALTAFNGDLANVFFQNNGSATDRMVVANYVLTYPRKFDFDGQSQFSFQLPANNAGSYLAIGNFNYGSANPVLYDLTNGLRLTGIVSSDTVRFVLPPSATTRDFVLLSTDPSASYSVNSFQTRHFIDYSTTPNQGDYMIISDSSLFNDGSGNNNVANYRDYRSSADGGSYNTKVYDIQQLIDQFAFGVKHHPSSIRNFSAYANDKFSIKPKFLLLIGKGLDYVEYRTNESNPKILPQALIPTFGAPASDNLLTATRTGETTTIPIGRLSAIKGSEIGEYLDKVKEFEQVQKATVSPDQNAWMKNIAQLTGGLSDPSLSALIGGYMQGYRNIAMDTLFGANVYDFNENISTTTATGTNTTMQDVFSKGMTLLTYFGHSSPNSIEFNLDDPQNYNNTGKYPAIIINGCLAGNLFTFDTLRAFTGGSLSEKFTFADKKGSIAFISSSHFGLPTELNFVNSEFYRNFCKAMYGQPLGAILQATMTNVYNTYYNDYIALTHIEEINLHGDPAIRLNPLPKPDYTLQDSSISFAPTPVSIADSLITVTVQISNYGKATSDSIPVVVKHTFASDSVETVFDGKIKAVPNKGTMTFTFPINPLTDTGLNKITVIIDPNNIISELSENNNTASNTFTIIADEIRPIWPYKYAIVGDPNVKIYGSTANPTAAKKQYVLQIDTTLLFNSPSMVTRNVTDSGGAIQFTPGVSFVDSTVYYWRVAVGPVTANTRWLSSSFTYIGASAEGYSQGHYFQYKDNTFSTLGIDSITRKFSFTDKAKNLSIRTGLYGYYDWDQVNVNLDDDRVEYWACNFNELQILVYDPYTLLPWQNYNTNGSGRFGSKPVCVLAPATTRNFFEFPYDDPAYRKNAIQFFDSIPDGYYVSITNFSYEGNTTFIDAWKADTATLGSGKSLWNKFHQLGLNDIDSFTNNLPFLFFFRKGDASYHSYQQVGPLVSSYINQSFILPGKQVQGTMQSPWLGPVKAWKRFKWNSLLSSDTPQSLYKRFDIIGKNVSGTEIVLKSIYNAKDTDISYISAAAYPNLKLQMYNEDDVHAQPMQLKYWMLTADKVPEGAVSPNLYFSTQDSLTINDTLRLRVAFKNVSNVAFDSLSLRLVVTDKTLTTHVYTNLNNGARVKPLQPGDTAIIYYAIPLLQYSGQNQWMLEVNPANAQPEQIHFNNILYRSFYVSNPICPGGDVSFTVGASILGSSYQWQVNNGSGYTNLNNDAVYSGVNSSTLLLHAPPSNMYGYRYRCATIKNGNISYSKDSYLQFVTYWTGAVDTAWETTGNWSCGILPDANTDVVIKTGLTNYPVVKSNSVCRSISASPGSTITINVGFNLDVKGNPK
ncbi:putative type IX secretion system sortase PorU2 [Ferruginibacter albus]|uniref:putative type IX secretion system sortase PorU2 n=1 Tax=Ferruginibacter albus TaxID=2875540 RepID=UPI001CC6B7C1|nr:C25 family cysteine peptidase [Ferruginibacter albus]UAY51504.1 hypothetical protein K9M53_13020 [Ferruginibacter albus]